MISLIQLKLKNCRKYFQQVFAFSYWCLQTFLPEFCKSPVTPNKFVQHWSQVQLNDNFTSLISSSIHGHCAALGLYRWLKFGRRTARLWSISPPGWRWGGREKRWPRWTGWSSFWPRRNWMSSEGPTARWPSEWLFHEHACVTKKMFKFLRACPTCKNDFYSLQKLSKLLKNCHIGRLFTQETIDQ